RPRSSTATTRPEGWSRSSSKVIRRESMGATGASAASPARSRPRLLGARPAQWRHASNAAASTAEAQEATSSAASASWMRERAAQELTPDRRPQGAGRPSRPPQGRGVSLGGSVYQASARLLRAVPARLRHAAAAPGGTAWFWLSAAQRRAALDNYCAALGRQRDDPEVARVARHAFQNYGRMLMDFLLLGSLSPAELMARVSVDGRDQLDAAI